MNSVLRLILRESARLINCSRCSLFVLNEAGDTLTASIFNEGQDEVACAAGPGSLAL